MPVLAACTVDTRADDEPRAQDEREDSPALTCAMLTTDNCWTEALVAIASCAPGEEAGQLSSDGLSCSHPGGATVVFAENATTSPPNWSFAIERDGSRCAAVSFTEGDVDRWELATSTGLTTYETGDRVTLTCPDGATYGTDALALLSCGVGLTELPGHITGYGEDYAQYQLTGGADGPVNVFTCTR
jgi:hypothetical protein